jgi:hypothetical protein
MQVKPFTGKIVRVPASTAPAAPHRPGRIRVSLAANRNLRYCHARSFGIQPKETKMLRVRKSWLALAAVPAAALAQEQASSRQTQQQPPPQQQQQDQNQQGQQNDQGQQPQCQAQTRNGQQQKPSVVKDAGNAAVHTGGAVAGGAVGGPIGAAVGGVVADHGAHVVKKVVKGKGKNSQAQQGEARSQACAAQTSQQHVPQQ